MLIRNLLFYAGLIPVTFILTILGWLFFFFPHRYRYWLITRWSHFFIFWAKLTCGLRYEVLGKENIPSKNAIVLSNHQSAWETIFLQVLLPIQSWVLKKELLYIPVFGWGLALIEPIAINRKQFQSVKELIRQGRQKLQQGRFVVIFPEGTRVPIGEERRFAKSGAALSKATGYAILPIAHNAGKFWPKGFFIKQPGTIKISIGPLIEPNEKTIEEINMSAEQWIKKEVTALCH